MSRSTGFKDTTHPCKVWIQQKADGFQRYDKELGKNVVCDLSEFIILDYGLFRVVGYNEGLENGVLSNEVRSIKDELVVYTFLKNGQKVIHATGSYSDIKDIVKSPKVGGKYAQSVYIAIDPSKVGIDSDEPLVIANICVTGATFDGWLEWFNKAPKKDIANKSVGVTGFEPKKKGKTEYFAPIFEFVGKIDSKDDGVATTLDKVLQEYLDAYLHSPKDVEVTSHDIERQAESGHESQVPPEEDDGPPPPEEEIDPLDFKLKDGRTLRKVDSDEIKGMIEALEPKLGSDHDGVKTLKKALAIKTKSAKNNPFISEENLEDDDDIPF
jgi:hypothetical protein